MRYVRVDHVVVVQKILLDEVHHIKTNCMLLNMQECNGPVKMLPCMFIEYMIERIPGSKEKRYLLNEGMCFIIQNIQLITNSKGLLFQNSVVLNLHLTPLCLKSYLVQFFPYPY